MVRAVVAGCDIEELHISEHISESALGAVDGNLIIAAVLKLKVVSVGWIPRSVVVALLKALVKGDHGGVLQELIITTLGAGVDEELVKEAKERAGLRRLEVVYE